MIHTKTTQWIAFSKLVENYNVEYINGYNLQQNLDYYVSNISEEDSDIPLAIASLAYNLYTSLTDDSITFRMFCDHLTMHIGNYVVPQYGDFPDKTIKKFTVEKIQGKLEAYVDRIGRSSRGKQDEIVDSLKIAHFACYLYCLITTGNAQEIPLQPFTEIKNGKHGYL